MTQHFFTRVGFTSTILGMALVWQASAATQPSVLNLGILGGQNSTQQIGDNQCVKQFLDHELKVDTRLRNASDYTGITQGLLGGKVDVVLNMSPAAYASVYIRDPDAVEVIGITADDKTGVHSYHSVVVVKTDSPYQSLDDLKGKPFAFADPDSTSGYLIPDYAFRNQLGGNVDNQYNHFFSSITFSGGHEQDILGVLNGQFAGAVTYSSMTGDRNSGYSASAFHSLMRMGYPDLMKQIRIIWQSPPIPSGPILVSNALPAEFKSKVVAAIKNLDTDDHACFIKAVGGPLHISQGSVADFQLIIDMKRELLSTR
ncbi:phosphonate ABC transporter substrate-binding protein [Serratia fonticola]|uniref:phosphonate ABC transporter substrate-binding protein n=1 Tax=Serratia fonticola TaxID=47917 RepID=UPI0008FD00A7|nr:phosphonate ABC transporter substrate-binding protein [Serratia fonticola]MBC3252340.1 phosphonate ABC transporter substrate-binding protein [Serratia fonticola]OIX95668.1 phosphonate ABC transporter substrate-binding protein [Serratia fonticola]QCR62180.1 phosphonate ABC transporter substrate-binding protein [Serratia fonticola]